MVDMEAVGPRNEQRVACCLVIGGEAAKFVRPLRLRSSMPRAGDGGAQVGEVKSRVKLWKAIDPLPLSSINVDSGRGNVGQVVC